MKFRKIVAMTLVVVMSATLLAGCGKAKTGNATIDNMSPQELGEALVRALNERSQYKTMSEDLQAQVDDLQKKVQGVQFADPEFPAIDKVQDDTGRLTFKKPGDYVKLPDPLYIRGTDPASVDNKISMGGAQGITLKMTPIWSYRIEGNKLWMSTVSGIYGVVVIGKLAGNLDMNMVNTLFDGSEGQPEIKDAWGNITQPYIPMSDGIIKSVPADPGKPAGKDGTIFWNSNKVGRQVVLHTSIEGKSGVFRAGAFAAQTASVTYVFMYDKEMDASLEDTITTAIQSISIQNIPISIEH
jgi:hypothetical protein